MNTSAHPFFTVVIPTYNRPDYLREAISSVLNQTFEHFEIIVVDDNAEEPARPVVESFKDNRLHYCKNDHQKGGAGTRNAGIFRSKGEWIAFLDDDDLWLPEKLERQYQKIRETDNDVGLVYTGHTRFDPETYQPKQTFVPKHEGWLYQQLLYENVIGGLYSVVIRRDILERVEGLDERFPALQDADLYVRVAKLCKVAFVEEPLVQVRDSKLGRITTNYNSKLQGNQLFWEKYRADLSQDKRLTHRAASRVFMFAVPEGNLRALAASTPWTLAGLILDRKNIIRVARFVVRVGMTKLTRGKV